MANTFMIEVRFNGRPVYANVYVHTKGQLTYHVDFIGESLPEFLRDTIVLVYEGDELKAREDGIPQVIIKKIIDRIESHFR
jgi:hypothetical protein